MPAGCLEVGFKADPDCANVRRAWEVTERLVDGVREPRPLPAEHLAQRALHRLERGAADARVRRRAHLLHRDHVDGAPGGMGRVLLGALPRVAEGSRARSRTGPRSSSTSATWSRSCARTSATGGTASWRRSPDRASIPSAGSSTPLLRRVLLDEVPVEMSAGAPAHRDHRRRRLRHGRRVAPAARSPRHPDREGAAARRARRDGPRRRRRAHGPRGARPPLLLQPVLPLLPGAPAPARGPDPLERRPRLLHRRPGRRAHARPPAALAAARWLAPALASAPSPPALPASADQRAARRLRAPRLLGPVRALPRGGPLPRLVRARVRLSVPRRVLGRADRRRSASSRRTPCSRVCRRATRPGFFEIEGGMARYMRAFGDELTRVDVRLGAGVRRIERGESLPRGGRAGRASPLRSADRRHLLARRGRPCSATCRRPPRCKRRSGASATSRPRS